MATTVADADVLIKADVSDFASDLRRKLTPIMRSIEATLDVLADTTAFTREVNRAVQAADRETALIQVDADTGRVDNQIADVRDNIDRRPVTIPVTVDVDRDVGRIQGRFTEQFKKIGGESGKNFGSSLTDSISSSLQDLTAILPRALANPVVLGVAIIIGVLAAIPAAAVLAATAITAVGLGFLGLGAFALRGNKEVTTAFERMADRIGKVFTDAAEPLVKPLVKAFDTIGDAVENISPQLEEAFITLAPVIDDLADGLAGFIENVMPGLVDILVESAPLLETFAEELPGLGEALSDFFTILGEAGPDAVDALKLAFDLLKIVLIAVASIILALTLTFGAFKDIIEFIVDILETLFETLTGMDFEEALAAVEEFALETGKKIREFVDNVQTIVDELPGIIVGAITQAKDEALKTLLEGITSLIGAASKLPIGIYNAVVGVIRIMGEIFGSAVNSARSFFVNGINAILSLAASIPGRIRSAIGNLGSILVSAGRSIINGLIEGINDRLGALRSTLSSVTKLIPKIKGPEDVDKKLLTPAGKFIMEGLIAGIDSGVDDLERRLRSITGLFEPTVQATPIAAGGAQLSAGTTTTNSRTFAPIINVTVNGDGNGDETANAIVRRLLTVGV